MFHVCKQRYTYCMHVRSCWIYKKHGSNCRVLPFPSLSTQHSFLRYLASSPLVCSRILSTTFDVNYYIFRFPSSFFLSGTVLRYFKHMICCNDHKHQCILTKKLLTFSWNTWVLIVKMPHVLPPPPPQNTKTSTSWWFQPIRKILVKLDHLPQVGVKIENIWVATT